MTHLERVLIVDDDADVRDLLMDQIFHPSRFEIHEARDGAEGLSVAAKHPLDLIYLDLVMPGLTGKDMLVGLKSHNYSGPVIVGVKRGMEKSAIEAFRFGATDYIAKPIREAEMQSVVDRALSDVRLRRERNQLFEQLEHSNQQLEARLNQLKTMQTLGQTLTAMHSLDGMFEEVLAGAVDVTGADHAALILHDENSDKLILRAGKNMTLVMQERLGDAIKDELARMVMTSQQPMIATGEGLRRFKLSRDMLAVIYVPLVVNGRAIGVLTAGNHRKRRSFDETLADTMNVLADFAAIAIMNARLFVALQNQADAAQTQLQNRDQAIATQLRAPLQKMGQQLSHLAGLNGMPQPLKEQLTHLLHTTQEMHQFVNKLK
jgi:DNA-binding response OmpR family regulator